MSETIVETIRRDTTLSGSSKYVGQSNAAVLVQHFCESWRNLRQGEANESYKQITRKAIAGSAYKAFQEMGYSLADSEELARGCVGLMPGEKIVVPRGNL